LKIILDKKIFLINIYKFFSKFNSLFLKLISILRTSSCCCQLLLYSNNVIFLTKTIQRKNLLISNLSIKWKNPGKRVVPPLKRGLGRLNIVDKTRGGVGFLDTACPRKSSRCVFLLIIYQHLQRPFLWRPTYI